MKNSQIWGEIFRINLQRALPFFSEFKYSRSLMSLAKDHSKETGQVAPQFLAAVRDILVYLFVVNVFVA